MRLHLLFLFLFLHVKGQLMKHLRSCTLMICLVLSFVPTFLSAQFYTLETENLRLAYYGQTHAYMVKHVARCFERSLGFYKNLFQYTPSEKVTVLLHDFGDFGNASAGAVPKNHITVGIEPIFYAYETIPANERMNWFMNHETVHLVAQDMASGKDKFFRSIFLGKVMPTSETPISMLFSYWTSPRVYSPRWYHEGIAVFLETWMSGGYGRALGAYDEMVFRTLIREEKPIFDLLGLESAGTRMDFQVGVNAYLYGTRFFSFLAREYGPESLIEWTSRKKGSKGYFVSQFKNVYGLSLDDAWSNWIDKEKGFQVSNLTRIRENSTTPYRTLTKQALGSVSRPFYDARRGRLYAAVYYPGRVPHIASIDVKSGRIDRICDVKGAALYYVTSLAYDEDNDKLFYTTDHSEWRDLRVVNLKTGKTETLIKEGRVGDLVFNRADGSLWGLRHEFGMSTLVRIPKPYNEWNQIHTLSYGQELYDLDISPDGKQLIGTYVEINGKQSLVRMKIQDLLRNRFNPELIEDFGDYLPSNFVFSQDGNYLYGSSYYTGVSNIFRYEFATDEMNVITNCETGFFRPVPVSDDSLIVFRYSSDGFTPVAIPLTSGVRANAIVFWGNEVGEKHPVVKTWMAGKPGHIQEIDIDSLTISSGKFRGLSSIRLASAYPIVEGYKEYPAFGMRFNFSTPVPMHHIDITATYTPHPDLPKDERWHGYLSYKYINWNLYAVYNGADFYDLFGPTKASRKGYILGLEYKKTLLFDRPRTMDYVVNVAGFWGLEKLPDYQNISTSYDKFLTADILWTYKHKTASLGAFDHEKGWQWEIAASSSYVNGVFYPQLYTNFDLGFPTFIPHSSIWFRSSTGFAIGDRDEPFANFYFGGFGNNWVDFQTEKRYRKHYSFPGMELNAVGGTNYGKLLMEWTMPPIRFHRLGFKSFYSPWMRIAFFSTGIVTNIDDATDRRSLANVGAQVDFRILMLSHLKMTFSLGYAVAMEKHRAPSEEFMISLKIL